MNLASLGGPTGDQLWEVVVEARGQGEVQPSELESPVASSCGEEVLLVLSSPSFP
ncbi:hypothetical protein [Streptomyces avermitilis]|uniref:hypothetical protein n=1 Tax=Streptomyces avermitilis TaxID=33903 RepID=UPI0037FABAC1